VSIVVVPVSVVTAAFVLWAFGSTMNALVLAGLVAALVLVIDDAVMGIENVTRRLHQRERDGIDEPTHETVLDAILEVSRPTLYATLVVGLAVLPVFFLGRLSGTFFPHVATPYLVALVSSLAVALTVTPALTALLVLRDKPDQIASPPLVGWLQSNYARGLSRMLPRSGFAYVAIAGLVVLGVASAPFLHQSLLPTFKESQLLVHLNGPPGTSLREMDRITARASRELRSIPGVRDVGGHVGRAVNGDQIVGAESAELWVSIDRSHYDRTVAAVRQVVTGYPGLSQSVDTYTQEQVNASLAGASDAVTIRVYGEDLTTLVSQAEKIRAAVTGVDGIAGAHVLLPPEQPTLQVRVDLGKADKYGIKPGDVRRSATTLLSGLVVGSLFEQEKVFDVVVQATPRIRNSLSSVRDLLLETPEGGYVRLGDIASVRIAPSPAIIKRQAVSRYLDVGAAVSGRDRDAVVRDVQRQLQSLRFPIAYHAEVVAADVQPLWRLISIAIAAVVGMLLLLQAFFASWRIAALALLTLPVGAVGGLAALLVTGDKLSFGSYVALFAAFGLVTRHGTMLFSRFRQLEEDGVEERGASLVLRAASERLPSVVITTTAAALVLLPILIMGRQPGLELVHPLAVVLLGALITSLPYTLFVLPVMYLRFAFSGAVARTRAEDLPAALLDELAQGAATNAASREVPAGGLAVLESRTLPPERS
jgi:Cu/Ag efflux pump CusA